MLKRLFIELIFFFFTSLLSAQCPERTVVEKRTAYKQFSNYFSQGFLTELLGYLDKIQSCPYKNDSVHARLAKRIAKLYYLNADYLNAIKYYNQCISIIAAGDKEPSINTSDLPAAYYWLSMSYEALNMTTEKMKMLDSCYKAAMRTHHIDAACLRALYEWAKYAFDLGDYHRCIDYMQQCELLTKGYANLVPADKRDEFLSSSLLWQVQAMLELRDYNRAETLLISRMDECKNAGKTHNLGTIYSQFAELKMREQNYQEAVTYYQRSIISDQQVGFAFKCKQAWKNIGQDIYFAHFNDATKALACYRKALTFVNKDKSLEQEDAFESLSIYANIANAYSAMGNFDSALKYFQLAFDQINPGINEDGILRTPQQEFIKFKKVHYLTSLVIYKGDAFTRLYKKTRQRDALQNSILVYKKADQLLDRIKVEQTELESKLFWRSDSRRLYEHAIDACYLKEDIANAFYFFEKSRAVLLQDQLNEQKLLGQSDIMKQTQLNKNILQLEKERDTADKSSKRYSDLQDLLFRNRQELENIKDHIKTTNPLYYQNFMSRDSVTITDVQQRILKDHEALVELFAGDSAVYVLIISRQGTYFKRINKTAFENLSNAYINYLSKAALLNSSFDSFTDVSNQLYHLIFGKIDLPAGRIIISPYGRYFPFESLLIRQKPRVYFVENYSVSYTYSARYLLNDFLANSNSSSHTFIGFAPVHFDGLMALTGSGQSLEKIQEYFRNAASFVGAKATKNNFLAEYSRYKIIQLYTHATDSSSSGDPAISFADSTLFLSDLFYENRPASSLIVLSACETANGKSYNGEGVFSFNRQFAALGIPSCVSTLWQADDRATYQITELFYKYLAKGQPLDVALQSAKQEFMNSSNGENKLPYYWAACILVGKSDSIPLQKPFPWKWATAAVVALALLTVGGWQVRRKRNEKNKKTRNFVFQS